MGVSEKLIAFFVRQLSGKVTKTQLVKLMFLADLQSTQFSGNQISDVRWKFHHYGPYDEKLDDRLRLLVSGGVLSVEERSKKKSPDKTYFLYSYKNSKGVDLDFEPEKKDILNTIVQQFGSFTLDALLKYVYQTPVMKATKKGEYIDLKAVTHA